MSPSSVPIRAQRWVRWRADAYSSRYARCSAGCSFLSSVKLVASGGETVAHSPQITDEHRHRVVAILWIGSKDGGRVKGRHGGPAELRLEELAVVLHHLRLGADYGPDGSGTQADHDLGVHDVELGLEPWRAGLDLLGLGRLVDAPLALRRPLEMLDDVGDVGIASLDPRLLERLVEDPAGRPHEGMPLDVLAVTGLLADQHQPRPLQPLAEDRLGSGLVERAGRAARGGFAQLREGRVLGDQRVGAAGLLAGQRKLTHKVVLPRVASRHSAAERYANIRS